MPYIPKPKPKAWEIEARKPKDKPVHAFYNQSRWKVIRQMYRARNPLCVLCLKDGKTEPATCVDHIIPISRGGPAWDENNLQSLCDRHHKQKTIREQREAGIL